MFYAHKFRQTTLMTVFCGSILAGLAVARRAELSVFWPCAMAIIVALLFCRARNYKSLVLITLAGVLIGLWRGSYYMQKLADYQPLMRRPVSINVTAAEDAVYADQGQLTFAVQQIQLLKPYKQALAGSIKITGFGATMVYRGDQLIVNGSLSPTKGSNQAKLSFAKFSIIKHGNSWLDNFRRRFVAGLTSALPEPEASFGVGLLIGQRSTIPQATNDQLSTTGLTHLVAVSGYNLTIIIMAVRRLVGKRSKFQSTTVAISLVLAFVLVTGLSASIVRAALVSMLSLLAWYYGRSFKPLLLIGLSAAATAYWKPFYLWADIGWYLSFLAFFGVLMLAPLIVKLLVRGRGPPKMLPALLAETLSAQLLTLPIIMYIFGRLSLIGLVSNLLVVPLVPLAMLLTLLSGLGGMVLPVFSGWLAWPARLLLTYMLEVVGVLSGLPHAAVQHTLGLSIMLILYGLIIGLVVLLGHLLRSPKSSEYGTITDNKEHYVGTQQMVNHQTTKGR